MTGREGGGGAALIDGSKSRAGGVKPLQREQSRAERSDGIPGQTGRLRGDSQGSGGRGWLPEMDTERRVSAAGHEAAMRRRETSTTTTTSLRPARRDLIWQLIRRVEGSTQASTARRRGGWL